MNIGVATLVAGDGYEKAVSLAIQTKQDYCALHGYDLVVGKEFDRSRPIPWSKIPLLQKILPKYDLVFWSDADAMVVNYDISLNRFFHDFLNSDKKMLTTLDAAGNINTGNFLIRNSPWSFEFLGRIWEQEQFTNHGWWENMAFIHLLETDPEVRRQVTIVQNRQLPFNSYPHHNDYREGDFIVHFAGVHDLHELELLVARFYKDCRPKSQEFEFIPSSL